MVFVYVIQSLLNKAYYIGISKDVEKRLLEHNKGKTRSTKERKPFKLIHKEKFNNYKEARLREIELKSFKGGNSFKELLKTWEIV